MEKNENWVQLQHDIRGYEPVLDRAAMTVRDEGVSNYPIFVAYAGSEADKVPGIFVTEIVTSREVIWTVNVTTLEELVAKQVVDAQRVDPFRKVYREKADGLCFLIIDADGARFGFVDHN